MKGSHRSPGIRRAIARARALGFRVEFVPFVESADTPGVLGAVGGLCDQERKLIRVRTHGMTRVQILAILEHELEHAAGAERGSDRPDLGLRCGGTRGGGSRVSLMMDRPAPTPPPALPCPNPECFALPEATTVCRFCGALKTAAKVSAAFRLILAGEPTS